MVTSAYGLHPIEKRIADALKNDGEVQLNEMDCCDAILQQQSALVNSRFLPEIFSLLLQNRSDVQVPVVQDFILDAFRQIEHGPLVQPCVDVIDPFVHSYPHFGRPLFETFVERSLDLSMTGLARTAFLEGCIRLTIRDTSRRHALIGHFLDFDLSGLGYAKQRFVKMLGVCHSHWGCGDTESLIRQRCDDPECCAEANLELGLHHFGRLLESVDPGEAKEQMSQAEQRFRTAGEHASVNAESTIYRLGCRIVRDFSEGELSVTANQIANELDRAITALRAYHRTDNDPQWLGSRTIELLHWRALHHRLSRVNFEMERAAWFEPSELIVSSLAPIYSASRTLLARDELGGIETLLQPRIICTIAQNPGHLENLMRWLKLNPDHQLAMDVAALIDASKAEIASSEQGGFVWGRTSRDRAITVFRDDHSKAGPVEMMHRVYAAAASLHFRQLNANHQKVMLSCIDAVKDHSDYRTADVRRLFEVLLLLVVCYIDSRLNLTKHHDPMVKFLFRRDDGTRAKEDELQKDFVAFIRPFLFGTEIEVEDIGSGRADVFLRCNAERMTCEVKRDHNNCDVDKLMDKYSDQTTQYQNSSARISFMLVLDQTNRAGRALHLADSIRPTKLELDGEDEPRHVIVCLVSGDRLRPSDLSRQSRKKRLGN